MTSFSLKILAYITMFSDHIGKLFYPNINIFNVIGRISFPVFAFLLAEGFSKTGNKKAYMNRLFIFGVISQAPYMYFLKLIGQENFYKLNILFTLFFGLVILYFFEKRKYILLFLISFFLILFDAIIGFDYSVYGILLIISSYIFTKNRLLGALLMILVTGVESFNFSLPAEFSMQIFAVLSLIPILFYNQKLGKKINRYWFYLIYPLHFLVLIGIFLL